MPKCKSKLTPNDQRSIALNPTSAAYRARLNNRSNQLNPNHSEYRGPNPKEN